MDELTFGHHALYLRYSCGTSICLLWIGPSPALAVRVHSVSMCQSRHHFGRHCHICWDNCFQEAREKILESIDLWLPQLKMLMATDSGENDDPIEVSCPVNQACCCLLL